MIDGICPPYRYITTALALRARNMAYESMGAIMISHNMDDLSLSVDEPVIDLVYIQNRGT